MSIESFEGIHTLLSKYRKLLSDRSVDQKKIAEIITRVSGLNFFQSDFTLQKGEIHIIGSSVLKNEVFFHKQHILEELRKEGITSISEIH